MIWIDLIYNLALLIALSVVSGFVDTRWGRGTRLGAVLQGVVFGGAAAIGMLRPFVYAPGMIFDGRSVMLSLAGLFFGPWTAAVACLITAPLRLVQGGPGVRMGSLVILVSALLGIVFHARRRKASREVPAVTLLGFGLGVHLAMLAMSVALPPETIGPVLRRIGLPVLTVYPLATVLIGKILSDQAARAGYVESLRESEERYRALFEGAAEGIAVADMTTRRTLYANPAYCRMYGYTMEELAELPVDKLHPRESLGQVVASFEAQARSQDSLLVNLPCLRKDGSVFHANINGRPLLMAGRPVLVGFFRDITERLRAEQDLKASEVFLATLLQAMPIPVFYKNREGRYLGMNTACLAFFGAREEDWVGRTVFDLHPPELARLYDEQDAKLMEEGGAQQYEARVRDGQGILRYARFEKAVFRDPQGRVAGLIGTILDQTEQRRGEIERERLNAELERKARELQNVLYASSHDLRSPLLNIQGFSHRLERACAAIRSGLDQPPVPDAARVALAPILDEQIPVALRYIRASVERMDKLIGGMLRLSRVGQVILRREELDMDGLLREVVASLTIQIQAAGAVVDLQALPRCEADASLLGQVFANLLDNALKYRHPERVPRIVVSGREEDGQALYCVADNGSGIAAGQLEGVWELFRRLNPAGPAGEGLGLNLVRRIVERYGGRAWVESTLGQGSRFFVSLPRDRSSCESRPAANSAGTHSDPADRPRFDTAATAPVSAGPGGATP